MGELVFLGLLAFVLFVVFGGNVGPFDSGDNVNEEGRRNTRTDSNYQGYDRWL